MTGLEVKKILKNNGFSLKSIANLMNETPQNLNSMLSAKDIKTGVLEKIAIAIKKPLYFFYPEIGKNTQSIGNNVVASGKSIVHAPTNVNKHQINDIQIDDKDKLLIEKDERIKEKDAYIAELKEIIRELKSAQNISRKYNSIAAEPSAEYKRT
jgi:transcriptional regulator with XRE-family HTH domain